MICVSSLQNPPFQQQVSAPVLLKVLLPTSERGLHGMRHKQEAPSVLLLIKLLSPSSPGLPNFLKPCNTLQVNLFCSSMCSAPHHNVLPPPYGPNIFSTVYPIPSLGPFLVPTSATYSARCALPAWQATAATVAAPVLHECLLAT